MTLSLSFRIIYLHTGVVLLKQNVLCSNNFLLFLWQPSQKLESGKCSHRSKGRKSGNTPGGRTKGYQIQIAPVDQPTHLYNREILKQDSIKENDC